MPKVLNSQTRSRQSLAMKESWERRKAEANKKMAPAAITNGTQQAHNYSPGANAKPQSVGMFMNYCCPVCATKYSALQPPQECGTCHMPQRPIVDAIVAAISKPTA